MKLRDYQSYAVNGIFKYFEEGKRGHPIVAMPTATGKSLVIASFVEEALKRYPGQRILMLTHVKELIDQNFIKLKQIWPTAPAGIYSAGLRKKDLYFPITYAGIASIKSVLESLGTIHLILVDECHLISNKDNTTYRSVIQYLTAINPHLKVIGFSATPYRTQFGLLTNPGGLFTDICVDMTGRDAYNWFISQGYLSNLIARKPSTELDLDGVRTTAGDYNLGDLERVTDQEAITHAACQEMVELGRGRYHWLIFALSIQHAENIASHLEGMGVSAVVVHSKLSTIERDYRTKAFTSGKVRALVNMGVYTTGFDYPNIDLIGALRATQSTSLWVQMVGRGGRVVYAGGYDLTTKEGRLEAIKNGPKQNCLILDFAGNTERLGPVNDPVIPKEKNSRGGGAAPVKLCDACQCYNHISARVCEQCGEPFTIKVKIKEQASAAQVIVEAKVEEAPVVADFSVSHITYGRHEKHDRPPSMKVTYTSGLRTFSEWICFEHEGVARNKAHFWWARHGGQRPAPATVADALERIEEIKEAVAIKVWVNKKYPEIMNYEFGERKDQK